MSRICQAQSERASGWLDNPLGADPKYKIEYHHKNRLEVIKYIIKHQVQPVDNVILAVDNALDPSI